VKLHNLVQILSVHQFKRETMSCSSV